MTDSVFVRNPQDHEYNELLDRFFNNILDYI